MLQIRGHRILIKPFAVEEVDEKIKAAKSAGIYIPETENQRIRESSVDRGVVVQVGSTAFKDFGTEAWCSVGDEVMFAMYAGKKMTDPYSGEKFVAINDEDIVAVIVKE